MSLSNKLEELLSGYLDNQLNPDELREVESALHDSDVQAHLASLQRNRDSLKAIVQQPSPSLPPDFTQLVMAKITAQPTVEAGKKENAAVILSKPTSGTYSRIVAAMASIAAMVVFAIYFSQDRLGLTEPGVGHITSNDSGVKLHAQPSDFSTATESPVKQNDSTPIGSRLVSRGDFQISYLMTVDIEIPKNQTSVSALAPILEQHGIQLVKGAKVTDEVQNALDELRMTKGPQDEPSATEVYLLKASLSSMDAVLEAIRSNPVFPSVRFGMAYELPSEPLLEKLSADVQKEVDTLSNLMKESSAPILLGRAIANSVVENQEVTVDQPFASPLIEKEGDVRPSPFDSIPEQGKLVTSSNRRPKNTIQQQTLGDDEKCFALLFVRQAK